MTAEEYKEKKTNLIITRKKLNEARRELDERMLYELFPAAVDELITIKIKKRVTTYDYYLTVGKTYQVKVINARLNSPGTGVRVDFSAIVPNYGTKIYYGIDAKRLEVVK